MKRTWFNVSRSLLVIYREEYLGLAICVPEQGVEVIFLCYTVQLNWHQHVIFTEYKEFV